MEQAPTPAAALQYPLLARDGSQSPLVNPSPGDPGGDLPHRTSARPVYTPYFGATSEMSSFPHWSSCLHCSAQLTPTVARYGTGLCDKCYDDSERECQVCGRQLALKQLHFFSGMCNDCYDGRRKACLICNERLSMASLRLGSSYCEHHQPRETEVDLTEGGPDQVSETPPHSAPHTPKPDRRRPKQGWSSFDAGVKIAIASQFIFYLAPGIMVPSLFIEIQAKTELSGDSAASSYSFVLMTCTVVAMVGRAAPSLLPAPSHPGFCARGRLLSLIALTPATSCAYSAAVPTTAASHHRPAPPLLSTADASQVAPMPFGIWAESRGEREVYAGVTLLATVAALLLAFAENVYVFALSWY